MSERTWIEGGTRSAIAPTRIAHPSTGEFRPFGAHGHRTQCNYPSSARVVEIARPTCSCEPIQANASVRRFLFTTSGSPHRRCAPVLQEEALGAGFELITAWIVMPTPENIATSHRKFPGRYRPTGVRTETAGLSASSDR